MYLNMFDHTPPMPGRTQNASQHAELTHPMPAGTQNVSKHVLTKPLPRQRGHKMHLNLS
jgi:hypothetical protein